MQPLYKDLVPPALFPCFYQRLATYHSLLLAFSSISTTHSHPPNHLFLSFSYKLPSTLMGEENHTQTKMPEDKTQPMAPTQSTPRLLLTVLAVFLILAGTTSLVVWLAYRPSKPQFSVVGAAVYDMNTTSPFVISTNMQFTVVIHNPNKHAAAYYDCLNAFVSYRNQAITAPVPLPPLFQKHQGTVAMSPMLGGGYVPVSTEVSSGIAVDEAYGVVGLRLVLLGRVRWKAGAFWSGHFGMSVTCDLLVGLKTGYVGQVPLLGLPDCRVDI